MGRFDDCVCQHLVERYGIDEVSQWYFEVWNEPNIDFWRGTPKQATYFELYDHTARALKAVNARIRVGGPATAQAAWVGDMIAHATQNQVPLDFVSTHVYGNDSAENVFHDDRSVAPHQMVCQAVKKVHDEIEHSARPKMPLIWSEFNATYANEQELTDSIYMGPWMAETISQCDGMVNMMSYWTFSDVFEEQGVVKTPFYGGFGLLAEDGIPKPAFDVFALLHELGDQRLPEAAGDVLATRRNDGTLVIAAWNLVEPGADGKSKTIAIDLKGISENAHATIRRVDSIPWRYAGRVEEDGKSEESNAGANRRVAQSLRDRTAGSACGHAPSADPNTSADGACGGGDSISDHSNGELGVLP